MAVILPSEHHAQWLDPRFQDTEKLVQLLVPCGADRMKTHPVSTLVNNWRNDVAKCVEALSP